MSVDSVVVAWPIACCAAIYVQRHISWHSNARWSRVPSRPALWRSLLNLPTIIVSTGTVLRKPTQLHMMAGLAEDWEKLWAASVPAGTRWDIGGPHKQLILDVAAGSIPNGRALVPGCGRGHDLSLLASPQRFVIGLEISPSAVAEANAFLAAAHPTALPFCSVVFGDFFNVNGPLRNEKFDFVLDYTFLCATLPTRRVEWAARMADLILPGGELYCINFPLGPYPVGRDEDLNRGPPFQLSKQLYHTLLEAQFECVSEVDVSSEMSHPVRAGLEAISRWRRRS